MIELPAAVDRQDHLELREVHGEIEQPLRCLLVDPHNEKTECAQASGGRAYDAVVPVSAKSGDGMAEFERAILERLPRGAPMFGSDELTDRSERFLAAELVREQVMLRLSEELPYATTVEIEQFEDHGEHSDVAAIIWVEREGQKGIVIGAGGEQLKAIGTAARHAMERLFGRKVFLRLWVKVRENWADDEAALRRFGYSD